MFRFSLECGLCGAKRVYCEPKGTAMVRPSVCASAWRLQTGDSYATRGEHHENESQNRIHRPLSRVGQSDFRATALIERELRSKQGGGSVIFQICHELTPRIIQSLECPVRLRHPRTRSDQCTYAGAPLRNLDGGANLGLSALCRLGDSAWLSRRAARRQRHPQHHCRC